MRKGNILHHLHDENLAHIKLRHLNLDQIETEKSKLDQKICTGFSVLKTIYSIRKKTVQIHVYLLRYLLGLLCQFFLSQSPSKYRNIYAVLAN